MAESVEPHLEPFARTAAMLCEWVIKAVGAQT